MNWTIFYRWVLANFLGGVVGYLAGLLFAYIVSPIFGDSRLLIGAAMGAVLGLAQWQILNAYLPDMRRSRWVGFTAIGFAFSWTLFAYLGYAVAYTTGLETGGDPVQGWINLALSRRPAGPIEAMLELVRRFPSALLGGAAIGALTGVMVGSTQVLVLRRHMKWSSRWFAATAIAGLVGIIAALYLSLAVYNGLYDDTALFIVSVALSPIGITLLGSPITGLALARMVPRNST